MSRIPSSTLFCYASVGLSRSFIFFTSVFKSKYWRRMCPLFLSATSTLSNKQQKNNLVIGNFESRDMGKNYVSNLHEDASSYEPKHNSNMNGGSFPLAPGSNSAVEFTP